MQNAPDTENKDTILQFCRVTVLLEPITETAWYEMKREQQSLPDLSDVNKLSCAFCLEKLIPSSTYAKCLECEQAEVLICLECFRSGMESHPHTRAHRYILIDSIGPAVFSGNETIHSWGAQEDLQLLNALLRAHLNQWPELSKDWGRKRTLTEALERLDRFFIRDTIGQYVLKNFERGFVKVWNEPKSEPCSSKILASSKFIFATVKPTVNDCDLARKNGKVEMPSHKREGDTTAANLSSFIYRRLAYFDEEEDSEEELPEDIGLRNKKGSTDNEALGLQLVSRKEKLLASAKNVAAEAIKGKMRKTSLELSEAAVYLESSNSVESPNTNELEKKALLTQEQLAVLFASGKFNPFFYNSPSPPMDAHSVSKFDEEDLQLLTYLPYRDEFETEYKNEAEQLITEISFHPENYELKTEKEQFINEGNYIRFDHYNRLMRIRAAKRAIILEHRMLAEYLNIVKTNICEKGKYNVFPDRYFVTKSREDVYKQVFAQLRQVSDCATVNQLAKDIAKMETLKDQIDELKSLQRRGVTKLKGRLKIDSASVLWSKKRRSKRSENVEHRKASLRWKRIKRWTKRTNLRHLQSDDQDDDQ